MGSLSTAIYSTPGNDEYVFKNRSSRLYGYALSTEEGRKIRDKTVKKKIAIPKKDMTTPDLLAQAALDWFIILMSTGDAWSYMKESVRDDPLYQAYFGNHKKFLIDYYGSFNRTIFNDDGCTICCVTGHVLTIKDVCDPDRDQRIVIRDTDLQMGHNIPREDNYITIRGCNLLPQTRRGNQLIGENIFKII